MVERGGVVHRMGNMGIDLEVVVTEARNSEEHRLDKDLDLNTGYMNLSVVLLAENTVLSQTCVFFLVLTLISEKSSGETLEIAGNSDCPNSNSPVISPNS